MAGTTNDCNALGVRRNLVVILAADVTVPPMIMIFTTRRLYIFSDMFGELFGVLNLIHEQIWRESF